MRPLRIELEGLGSYVSSTEIDLSGITSAVVVGENGAGKSTLIDSFVWVLTGQTRKGLTNDAIISDGADEASVVMEFEMGGVTWEVSRRAKRQAGGKVVRSASLKRLGPQGFELVASGVTDVDQALRDLLGLSPETLLSTAICSQGDSSRFTSAAPRERKAILSEILGLSRFDTWLKRTRLAKNALERQVHTLDTEIALLESQIAALGDPAAELAEAESACELVEADLIVAMGRLSELENLAIQKEHYKTRIAEMRQVYNGQSKRLNEDINAVRLDYEEAKAQLVDPALESTFEQAVVEATETVETLTRTFGDVVRSIGGYDNQIKAFQLASQEAEAHKQENEARLQTLLAAHVGTCWTCGQELTNDLRDALADGLRSEIDRLEQTISNYQVQTQLTAQELAKAKIHEADLNKALRLAKAKLSSAEAELTRFRGALERVPALRERMARATSRLDDLAGVQKDLEEQLASIRQMEQACVDLDAQLQDYVAEQKRKVKLVQEREELVQRKSQLNLRVVDVQVKRAEVATKGSERDHLRSELVELALLEEAFSPDGLPNRVFGFNASALQEEASSILGSLSDGRMSLQIVTTAERKDGSEVGALDVLVTNEGVERLYAALSGGERLRVDLSLRVALSRLLARRHDARIGLLAVDEGWGALDKAGVADLVNVLGALSGEYDLVITVTHADEVAAAFPVRLEVSKQPPFGSVVEVVG